MLKRIKKLLEDNAITLAIIMTLVIAFLSLSVAPKINLGLNIKSSDKILHTIAYFSLSSVWFFALRDKFKNRSFKTYLIISLIFYGIILEVLQGKLTSYRSADFYDAIANTLGIVIATVFFKKFLNWFNSI